MGGLIDDVIAPAAEDAVAAGVDVVTSAYDKATDVIDDAAGFLGLPPVAAEVEEALLDFVNGPLQDFANTAVGKVVLRAFAYTAYIGLAPVLGPQFAAVTFAIPGVLRGEPFDEAWVTEFTWRVVTLATILGGMYLDSNAVSAAKPAAIDAIPDADKLKDLIESIFKIVLELRKRFPDASKIDVMSFDYVGVARDFGVREDTMLEAVALYTRRTDALGSFCSNAATGQLIQCPT